MAESKELVVAPVEYDHDIEHVGSKITLPAEPKPMSTEDAIKVLCTSKYAAAAPSCAGAAKAE